MGCGEGVRIAYGCLWDTAFQRIPASMGDNGPGRQGGADVRGLCACVSGRGFEDPRWGRVLAWKVDKTWSLHNMSGTGERTEEEGILVIPSLLAHAV